MTTLSAALRCVHLYSPHPEGLSNFYSRTYGMRAVRAGDTWQCSAPGRRVEVSPGPMNRLRFALFACESAASWKGLCRRLAALPHVEVPPGCGISAEALCVADPDGNLIVFEEGDGAHRNATPEEGTGIAELQHFALRTSQLEAMLRFYTEAVGMVLSDRVLDSQGMPRAAFLRTNALHHALALFDAPSAGFDHQSFETSDWTGLRHWADRMGSLREVIVWGVGRHGPGNDVFFMVRDPDGNLAEISAEIEVCADDRPPGTWPHEERTLNLWGKAILRS